MLSFPLSLIIVQACFGSLAANFAKHKGHDPKLWFFLGALQFTLTMIVLLFLEAKDKKLLKKAQTPVKKSLPPLLWYYLGKENQMVGPITKEILYQDFLESPSVHQNTYVWNENMEEWVQLKDVESLQGWLKESLSAQPKKERKNLS